MYKKSYLSADNEDQVSNLCLFYFGFALGFSGGVGGISS
jgi:hypothetical protein